MGVIDIEQIRQSTSGDEAIMLDLITMGLERIDSARSEIEGALAGEDWDALARIVHKLRPVLHFVGLVSLEDVLAAIEKNAKEKTNLAQVKEKLTEIFDIFETAKKELVEIKNSLQK